MSQPANFSQIEGSISRLISPVENIGTTIENSGGFVEAASTHSQTAVSTGHVIVTAAANALAASLKGEQHVDTLETALETIETLVSQLGEPLGQATTAVSETKEAYNMCGEQLGILSVTSVAAWRQEVSTTKARAQSLQQTGATFIVDAENTGREIGQIAANVPLNTSKGRRIATGLTSAQQQAQLSAASARTLERRSSRSYNALDGSLTVTQHPLRDSALDKMSDLTGVCLSDHISTQERIARIGTLIAELGELTTGLRRSLAARAEHREELTELLSEALGAQREANASLGVAQSNIEEVATAHGLTQQSWRRVASSLQSTLQIVRSS